MRSYIPLTLIILIFLPSILILIGGKSLSVMWYDCSTIVSRLVITLWMLWFFNLDRILNKRNINAISIVLLCIYFGVTIAKVFLSYTEYDLLQPFGRLNFFEILEIVVGFLCLMLLYFPAKRVLPERSAWFIIFELIILPFAIFNWTQYILSEGLDLRQEESNEELLDK